MGRACIGLKVHTKDLIEDYEELGCKHKHSGKFCPECGAPAKKIRRWYKGDIEQHVFPAYECEGPEYIESIMGYAVQPGCKNDSGCRSYCIVMLVHTKWDDEDSKTPTPLHDIETTICEFRREMESIGLWNDDQFGLWHLA